MATTLTKAQDAAQTRAGECLELWGIIAALPFLTREGSRIKQWIADSSSDLPRNGVPFVKVFNDGNASWDEHTTFKPYIDGMVACIDDDLTLPECFEVLVEIMFLTDIDYTPELFGAWKLLAEVIMGCHEPVSMIPDKENRRPNEKGARSSFMIAQTILLKE